MDLKVYPINNGEHAKILVGITVEARGKKLGRLVTYFSIFTHNIVYVSLLPLVATCKGKSC